MHRRQKAGYDTAFLTRMANSFPVTVVEAGPCVVVQKKTVENDGYEAVQIGFGEVKNQNGTANT